MFQGQIPKKELKHLGDSYLKTINTVTDENVFYKIADDYFSNKLMKILTLTKAKTCATLDFARLFRHELLNHIGAKFELNINPEYKDFVEENAKEKKNFSYIKHQHKSFKNILNTV